MKLSDLEYFKSFEALLDKRQKDNTIIYYAQIFKLDVEKTLSIAHQYTNEYSNEEFIDSSIPIPRESECTCKQ